MNKFKEKPKPGNAKEKSKPTLLPRQAIHMMKEKYIKEMNQRPKGAEDSTQQEAPDQVERAGRWAADELTGRAVEQGRENAKKKFAAACGETQTGPEPVSNGTDHPTPEGTPRGQSDPEYPAAISVEHQEADRSPTTPKERPIAQAVKERPVADMPRTAGGQPTAAPAKQSEAVPPKFRPRQALKERSRIDAPRIADRAMVPRTAAPRSTAGQALAANDGRSETVPLKIRQQKALKKRPQLSLLSRRSSISAAAPTPGLDPDPTPSPGRKAPQPTKAALTPKARRGVIKAPAKPAARSASPTAWAAKAAHRHMQRRIFTQAPKPAKRIGAIFRRAVQAVAKASAAVTGAVSAIIGGCVLLVALVIIIVIAAVANSPFGLFFAQEPNTPGAVSVSQAVGSVNMAYNSKLELLQTGDYNSIDIQGAAPDWPEVLAVFAVKMAGADVGGMDVATLDADRVDKLTAVFWDMTDVTTSVETIPQEEYETLRLETVKVLQGKSRLDVDLLNSLVAETKEAIQVLEEQVQTAQGEMQERLDSAKTVQQEYEQLMGWADMYDRCTFEAKKMIVAQFVKAVRVRRDYEIDIEFNVSFEEFQDLYLAKGVQV